MAGIVIFAGTTEGRQLAEMLKGADIDVYVSTVSEYGGSLIEKGSNIHIHTGAMDREGMKKYIYEIKPDICVDATHPYALEATENIWSAAKDMDVEYVRVAREEGSICGNEISFESIDEAAVFLKNTEGNIFITTGSNEIEKYSHIENYSKRCVVRVLPLAEAVKKCRDIGYEGNNLICMQGPFSEEMNYCIMKEKNIKWLVTKNSGQKGGFEEKLKAAKKAGANVVIIGRKRENKGNIMSFENACEYIKKKFDIKCKKKIYIVGIGTGNYRYMTNEACKVLENADVIIGAKRMTEACEMFGKPVFVSYNKYEIADFIRSHSEYSNIALVYSGDIGFYSGARDMKNFLWEYSVISVPGISSVQYFMDTINVPWEDARLVSCHGVCSDIIKEIINNNKVCALTGKGSDINNICSKLMYYGMDNVKITVGERLSYDNEKITKGYAADMAKGEYDSLAVVLFENDSSLNYAEGSINDSEFIRGNVPMTKEEVRRIVTGKLNMDSDSILYDIGAGTGSVSIEASRICSQVYAVERNDEACELIERNKIKFKTDNVNIIRGSAPHAIEKLPAPTHVFIGGSGGNIKDIIKAVKNKNENARFVVTAVTLETVAAMEEIKREYPNTETVAVNVSRAEKAGRYSLLKGGGTVFIFSF